MFSSHSRFFDSNTRGTFFHNPNFLNSTGLSLSSYSTAHINNSNPYKNHPSKPILKSNIPFQKKSVSQIKKENLINRQNSNRNMIESMYRSGRFFRYELGAPYTGTHKMHLSMLEERSRSLIPDVDVEKSKMIYMKQQCINLRNELKNDYRKLKEEMQDEVDNLQLKFMQSLNRQKIENAETRKKIKDAGSDLVETKNLIAELKIRINSLKLRIDGKPMFNEDGRPELNTVID